MEKCPRMVGAKHAGLGLAFAFVFGVGVTEGKAAEEEAKPRGAEAAPSFETAKPKSKSPRRNADATPAKTPEKAKDEVPRPDRESDPAPIEIVEEPPAATPDAVPTGDPYFADELEKRLRDAGVAGNGIRIQVTISAVILDGAVEDADARRAAGALVRLYSPKQLTVENRLRLVPVEAPTDESKAVKSAKRDAARASTVPCPEPAAALPRSTQPASVKASQPAAARPDATEAATRSEPAPMPRPRKTGVRSEASGTPRTGHSEHPAARPAAYPTGESAAPAAVD
jgi:hypothetical protein